MGERPAAHLTVERRDNDGNYEPQNCYWGTRAIQSRNRRANVWVDYDGERLILTDACKAVGVPQPRISNMVQRTGVTHQEAFDIYAFDDATVLSFNLVMFALAWVQSRPWPRGAAFFCTLHTLSLESPCLTT